MSSPVVFALDFAEVDEARNAALEVAPAIGMVKVGLELFVRAGHSAVSIGRDVALPVFLDLKLHDIPETVERAVAQVASLGVHLVTVHASGGKKMLERAVHAAGANTNVCAVTILTSLDDTDVASIGMSSSASSAALNLAKLAWGAGVRWFVCSPAEVATLRQALPEATLITPGIRPASAAHGDQKRVATPAQAVRDGANWLVVGRPIRDAENRLAAAQAINAELESAGGVNRAGALQG